MFEDSFTLPISPGDLLDGSFNEEAETLSIRILANAEKLIRYRRELSAYTLFPYWHTMPITPKVLKEAHGGVKADELALRIFTDWHKRSRWIIQITQYSLQDDDPNPSLAAASFNYGSFESPSFDFPEEQSEILPKKKLKLSKSRSKVLLEVKEEEVPQAAPKKHRPRGNFMSPTKASLARGGRGQSTEENIGGPSPARNEGEEKEAQIKRR